MKRLNYICIIVQEGVRKFGIIYILVILVVIFVIKLIKYFPQYFRFKYFKYYNFLPIGSPPPKRSGCISFH